MPELKPLPRTEKGLITLQEFVDPFYGSERYIVFKPEWVREVEDKQLRLPFSPFRKRYPITVIIFNDGKMRRAAGNWAEEILAERTKLESEKANAETAVSN